MYGVEFAAGPVKSLGEQGFVVFDTEIWNEEIPRKHEKNTRDPGEADGSNGWSVRVHEWVRGSRN